MPKKVQINDTPAQAIDRELTGDPITVDEVLLQPVAHLSGKRWADLETWGAAGYVHLSPTEVIVHDRDGAETHVALPNPTKQALSSMLTGMAAIAAFSLLIMTLATLWAWRAWR